MSMASQTLEIWVQEGEVRRQLEGDELKVFLAHQKQLQDEEKAKVQASLDAEIKRKALLEKLGITEDEAKLLLS